MQMLHKYVKLNLDNQKQVTLFLGKTGWGKSTTINYLDGVSLKINEDGHLIPKNSALAKTKIGDGFGSTTMIPILCDTGFGKVCDLPGD